MLVVFQCRTIDDLSVEIGGSVLTALEEARTIIAELNAKAAALAHGKNMLSLGLR